MPFLECNVVVASAGEDSAHEATVVVPPSDRIRDFSRAVLREVYGTVARRLIVAAEGSVAGGRSCATAKCITEAAVGVESSVGLSTSLDSMDIAQEKHARCETDSTFASFSKSNSEEGLKIDFAVDDASVQTQGLSTSIQEDLDAQGVSDELLEDWTNREVKSLAPVSLGAEALVLPPHVRRATMGLLAHIAHLAGLPEKGWFEASQLLDVLMLKSVPSSRHPDSVVSAINSLPVTCAALVAILKKNDCKATFSPHTGFSIAYACSFAKYLKGLGYTEVNAELTDDMVKKQEVAVLQALRWRIHVPTTESWMCTFCARFNVFTASLLVPSLTAVWQQALLAARLIMMHQASTQALQPKHLAAGLLAVGLVRAHVLPLEAVRPRGMNEEDWLQLYQATQLQPLHPQCAFPMNHSHHFLDLLTKAVGVGVETIHEYARIASFALKEALDAQARDRPRTNDGAALTVDSLPTPVATACHSTI